MEVMTCIIVGGGYAGIHAIKAIQKVFQEGRRSEKLRLILIDKEPFHLRKVLLFKPAAGGEEISIPFTNLFSQGVEFIQGTVTSIEKEDKKLRFQDVERNDHGMSYDILVLTLGSIVRQPDQGNGGIALTGLEAGKRIREQWRINLDRAASETNVEERKRLLTVAVAGAGISGIETSAELSFVMRQEAKTRGLDPKTITIYLLNAHDRLFPEGPVKVGHRLERSLNECGVEVFHGRKALQEKDGHVTISGGETIPVGLCIWTLGTQANPALRKFGLPLTTDGEVIVDSSYRVQNTHGVYSIGDCARIVDPSTGRADRKTCKEATAQAARLGKILLADVEGRLAPSHKGFMDLYCFGLGPERGMVWARQWGLDIFVTGKLGWKLRKFTWDSASLIK